MMSFNSLQLLVQPRRGWENLAEHMPATLPSALLYSMVFAALPAAAWYFGTTTIGWKVGSDDAVRLTAESAQRIVIAFYLVMIAAVVAIGYTVHWMAQTYGAQSSVARGIALAGFTATPLFIAGAVGFHPHLVLALALGVIAVGYAVYLLYTGIPIVMRIPQERGFLFASAVIAVALVILIAIMGASVILWDLGLAPVFTG